MSAPAPRPANIDVVAMLVHYGIKARTLSMVNLSAWCPFHRDTKPSLSINLVTGQWCCFGCERKGGLLDFIVQMEDINEWEALFRSREIARVERFTQADFNLFDLNVKPDRDLTPFTKGRERLDYLRSRGISPEIAKQFDVLWDKRREHVIFPVYWKGKVIGYQRRVTRKEDEALAKYRNSIGLPRKRILYWSKNYAPFKQQPALIVEGVIDVLKAYQYGWRNVMHSFGSRLSPIQIEMLEKVANRYGLIVWFDNDDAGKEASRKLKRFAQVIRADVKDVGEATKAQFHSEIRGVH